MHRHEGSSPFSTCHGTISECVFCCVFLTAFSTAAVLNSPPGGNGLRSQQSGSISSSACQDCAVRKMMEDPTSPEYRLARIEFIKQQILKKLRLREPPNVRIPRSILPSALADREVLLSKTRNENDDVTRNSQHQGDLHESMETAVILPQNGSHECAAYGPSPGTCFSFMLNTEISSRGVSHAELWAFKAFDPSLANQTFVVSELYVNPNNNHPHLRKRVVAFQSAAHKSGWIRFDVTNLITQWANRRNRPRGLEIRCKTCQGSEDSAMALIGTQGDKRPFLAVSSDPEAATHVRNKRSVDCNGSISRCCREPFYVSFHEIGWDGWIIQPAGYSANFCRGSCIHDISINKYHHTTVLQRYLQSTRSNETINLSLCCTPSRLSSISLIFIDQDQVLKQKSLPNMVVEACECA